MVSISSHSLIFRVSRHRKEPSLQLTLKSSTSEEVSEIVWHMPAAKRFGFFSTLVFVRRKQMRHNVLIVVIVALLVAFQNICDHDKRNQC